MSAAHGADIRTAARRFAVALTACLAVGGGAALVAAPDSALAPVSQNAGGQEDNGWPVPPPSPAPSID
ncbi:hypothetical protein [Streptomyces sp. NPDC008121]|uniref:hypothetical protein n=1 Tax=Streptomyces sp. NPDC008121 TaxID=3364809 RepID=UPI0036F15F9E